MKKALIAIFMILTFMHVNTTRVYAESNLFSIYVDGKAVKFTDAKPFIDSQKRTMIPLSAVVKTIPLTQVSWDANNATATVIKDTIKIDLPIGKSYGLVNGTKVEIDTTTVLKNSRTYVPLSFISTQLGYKVKYKFGKDANIGPGSYHVININSGAMADKSVVDRGFEGLLLGTTLEETNKIFPLLDNTRQVVMTGRSMSFDSSTESGMSINDDIIFRYERKGLISITFTRIGPKWDYFLTNASTYFFGSSGSQISSYIIKSINGVQYKLEGSVWYGTSKLVGNQIKVDKFNVEFVDDKEIHITFVEK